VGERLVQPTQLACNPQGPSRPACTRFSRCRDELCINAALVGRDRTEATIEMTTELMRPALLEGHYVVRGEVVRLTARSPTPRPRSRVRGETRQSLDGHVPRAPLDVELDVPAGSDRVDRPRSLELLQFGAGVHHERSVGRDGLANRLTAKTSTSKAWVRESWDSLAESTRKSPSTCTAIWPSAIGLRSSPTEP